MKFKLPLHSHSYKKSRNRETYERIAASYNVDPDVVYKIAHGKTPRTFDEEQAYHELLDSHIIWE